MSAAVEEVTTVDVPVEEQVSPGSRAVGAMPSVPDVPKALTDSRNPFAKAMVGSYRMLVGTARDSLAVIQRYIQGTAELDRQLNESEIGVVVTYRQALEQAQTELAESKAQYERDIAPFEEARKARDEAINKHVEEFKAPAVQALGAEMGVTLEESLEARQTYRACGDSVKSLNANLRRQGIDLGNYAFPPLKGNKGGSTSFTPRLGIATVDGVAVTPDAKGKVTPVQVAAALGITREQVIKLLLIQSLGGDRANFDAAAPHTEFHFNADGKHVVVTKGERKSSKVEGAIDSDDDDDDDEDSDD